MLCPHPPLQVEFQPGTVILRRGQRPEQLYIVKEGAALVKEGAKVVGRKEAGGTFGECALRAGEVCSADVVTEKRLVCYFLSRASMCSLLGPLEDVWRYETLKQVSGPAAAQSAECRVAAAGSVTDCVYWRQCD
jgi:signal-transduction protein with cAMP-binding, CBS, and nucleotidyltransferase domain